MEGSESRRRKGRGGGTNIQRKRDTDETQKPERGWVGRRYQSAAAPAGDRAERGGPQTVTSPLPSHSLWLGSLVPFCERPLTSCGPRPFLPWLSDPHLHGDFCAESWSVFLAAPLGLPCSHQFLLQELVGSHKGPAWPFLSSVLLGFFFRLCVHPHQTVSFRSLPFPLILLQAWVGSKHSFC